MNNKLLPVLFPLLTFSCVLLFVVVFNPEPRSREAAESGGRSGALEALDFWTRARAYPGNDIPKSAYYKAYQTASLKKNEIPRTMTAGSIWDPLGPLNLQGRCLSVALNPLNPSTIYVGSASGGLWRSWTGGTGGDWQQVKTGFPVLGVSSIVIDPVDTNTMYIGTGEVYRYLASTGGLVIRTTRGSYGVGILKTTNGGSTWTKSLDWSLNQQTGVQALKMNPQNRRTLWAATSEGIYKTTDAGASWENLIPGLLMIEDIVIHSVDTAKVMVSFGNFSASEIIVTTDAGANWTVSPIPSYTGKTLLEMYGANPNSVYADAADSTTGAGALYKSTNFGTSWTQLISYPVNGNLYQVQGWYSHFVAVHPTDSMQIVHAGVPAYKSTNGGTTFFGASGTYADHHGYAHHPTNPNILYIVNDDGVYRSDNFGSSYVSVGYGMQTGQFYNGFSCSTTDSLIALGQSQDHIPGYLYQGGSVWASSAVDESGFTAINTSNDNIMWAMYRYGNYVYRSTNRGASFSFSFNTGTNGAWNSPIVVAPSNPDIVYGATSKVFRTTTGGSSWQTLVSPLDGGNLAISLAVAPGNSDTVFVGMAPMVPPAHVFRTTNGGANWTNVTGTLPDRYPIDLAVAPGNSAVVYAAMGGFGSGHLFKSTDAGTSWSDISGSLPDAPATAIAIDPLHPSNVYVGNDLGVYVSTNGGGSWSGFSDGLPDAVIVADLTISPSNRALRVATHGNGVWERKLVGELPSDYFDYKVIGMNSPIDGGTYVLGSPFPSLDASFRNISAQAQTDSFDVSYAIYRGAVQVYSTVRRISGLGLGETRLVNFTPGFTPPDTAVYTVQIASLAADNNRSNDTVRGSFMVVSAPTIYNFMAQSEICTYQDITGGSPGPVGDDVQMQIALPFPFRYDGYLYDLAQISTNGWLEFGTGIPGTLRGLSTAAQLGGYFYPYLTTTNRPTKVIGVWYTDLSTDIPSSQVSYTTTGIAPDRVFVVQWKDISAYGTSTTMNFQVKLHETSNEIELDYGSLSAGTAPATGAGIALKDYIGGDNRFFDVLRDTIGSLATFQGDLNPLTDWPGPDKCYHIQTNPSGMSASVVQGWNLVSNPVSRSDNSRMGLFPTAISNAFSYRNVYQIVDSLYPGKGYWLKFPGAVTQPLPGVSLATIVDSVHAGWNLIGSVDHSIAPPAGGIVTGRIFGYNGHYEIASSVDPGKAYWLKAEVEGIIVLGGAVQRKGHTENFDACNSVTITDRLGRSQTLYLTDNQDGSMDAKLYELPPVPPDGLFDVRFASQRMLENYPVGPESSGRYDIETQGLMYPLTLSYSVKPIYGVRFSLEKRTQSALVSSETMNGTGSVTINNSEAISIRVTGSAVVPKDFALLQNYPNPFNPVTSITFDVPVKSFVLLTVYDLLGREVMILANGEYDAGTFTVKAEFGSFASGMYLYRMEARKAGGSGTESFSDVKKFVLVK